MNIFKKIMVQYRYGYLIKALPLIDKEAKTLAVLIDTYDKVTEHTPESVRNIAVVRSGIASTAFNIGILLKQAQTKTRNDEFGDALDYLLAVSDYTVRCMKHSKVTSE